MKGFFILIFFVALLFGACRQREPKGTSQTDSTIAVVPDTLIGRRIITDEIAGSAYRKRAVGYFTIVKGDTSDFMIVFSEAKEGGRVALILDSEIQGMSYREKLLELRAVFGKAQNEFNLDSLDAISLGRLMSHGDIAIDLTAEFQNKRGKNAVFDNRSALGFMMESSLVRDFDAILRKYSLRVAGFSLEKCHLTNGMQLPRYSKIEKDSGEIPGLVVDCLTWIKIGRTDAKAD